jgi:hypothetical protein
VDLQKIEKKLLLRLKGLGLLLLVFSLIAFVYSFFPQEEEELLSELSEEPPPLNIYFVASTFALVGGICIILAWRKKNAIKDIDR